MTDNRQNQSALRRSKTLSSVPPSHPLQRQGTAQPAARRRRPLPRAAKSFDIARPALDGFSSMLPASFQDKLAPPRFKDDKFEKDMEILAYTHHDVLSVVSEDEAFRNLKKSLRQRGCVTNGYIKENFHFYVQHVKEVKARKLEASKVERPIARNAAA